MLLLQLLIINFVNNIQESPHDDVNGGVFILHYWTTYILMHILWYILLLKVFMSCDV